jgi:hypothetical protein
VHSCNPSLFKNTSPRNATQQIQHKTKQNRLDEECNRLLVDILRIGVEGEPHTTFGELFDDDEVSNYYEALVGTLKAAKKRKLITYQGQLLLKGVTDKVKISIVGKE